MMNPSSPSPRWLLDFKERMIGGFNQESLFLQSSVPKSYHDQDWISKNCVAEEEKDMVMSLMFFQGRSYLDPMQNCDLPPPIKVFSRTETGNLITTKISTKDEDDVLPMSSGSLQYDEKLDLLKALQLSQTRAREAEKKAKLMTEERDLLSNTLIGGVSAIICSSTVGETA